MDERTERELRHILTAYYSTRLWQFGLRKALTISIIAKLNYRLPR